MIYMSVCTYDMCVYVHVCLCAKTDLHMYGMPMQSAALADFQARSQAWIDKLSIFVCVCT